MQCVVVSRAMGTQLFCRLAYALLPRAAVGDRPYVDRTLTLRSLPAPLANRQLVLLQTAQGDRRAGSGFTLRFAVLQESLVLLGFDSRARALPTWVSAQGFRRTGVRVEGLEDGYDYELYQKRVAAHTTLRLGGNSAAGARGVRRMYLVFVTRGEDLQTVEGEEGRSAPPSPAPSLDRGERGGDGEGGGKGHSPLPPASTPPAPDSGSVSSLTPLRRPVRAASSPSLSSIAESDRQKASGPTDPTAAFWGDESAVLHMLPPLFDHHGRHWSPPFNVEASNTTGTIYTRKDQRDGMSENGSESISVDSLPRTEDQTTYHSRPTSEKGPGRHAH